MQYDTGLRLRMIWKLVNIKHPLHVASWASGSYSYNIFAKGKNIDSGKFIVQH